MPDLAGLLKRLLTSWRGDVLLGALLAAWAIGYLSPAAARGNEQWTTLLIALPFIATVAVRRRWPMTATAVACAVLLAAQPLGVAAVLNGTLGTPLLCVPFLLSYTLGTEPVPLPAWPAPCCSRPACRSRAAASAWSPK
jgi:hypothetical protein